jgi:hypothetical protein
LPALTRELNNFCTEDAIFDNSITILPYNGILEHLMLANFMEASHYAYNVMKVPFEWGEGIITNVKCILYKNVVLCVKQLHW